MTAHRRENFGEPFRDVCLGARDIVEAVKDSELIYAVHPNPNVGAVAREVMGDHPRIRLVPPMNYLEFIGAMNSATIIITDSGGVQEEAPALGKPVLVFRRETERPEAVEAGVAKLVGTDRKKISGEAIKLLTDADYYRTMARGISPYGDGRAAPRIAAILRSAFIG
jgi:UDP-N-acetylglucosamine 2-epimerase (non-hydrolysing)